MSFKKVLYTLSNDMCLGYKFTGIDMYANLSRVCPTFSIRIAIQVCYALLRRKGTL